MDNLNTEIPGKASLSRRECRGSRSQIWMQVVRQKRCCAMMSLTLGFEVRKVPIGGGTVAASYDRRSRITRPLGM
jgi:hypothetical protein